MHVLITGGTGFIGSTLCHYFSQAKNYQISVLSRSLTKTLSTSAHLITDLAIPHSLPPYDVIINLAGEPLNRKRWNDRVKKNIYQSRLQTTQKIIEYIEKAPQKPKILISGSAIGFYGHSLTEVFTETSKPSKLGFTHTLCNDWENIAFQATHYGVRVCTLRTGIVLGKRGGALKEMILPFKWGLGAQLGDGQQWMSWIHEEDVVQAINFLIQHEKLTGPVNLTAPEPITNEKFTKELAEILHRPYLLTLPEFFIKVLFGEMGETLLVKGQKVIPEKLIQAGYQFKFPHLKDALENIINQS